MFQKSLILCWVVFTILCGKSLQAQDVDTTVYNYLWVKNENAIVRGVIGLGTAPELYVGQEYYFSAVANTSSLDLVIGSENLKVTLLEESKKMSGGYTFIVQPIDTGTCSFFVNVGADNEIKHSLIYMPFHASICPPPPVCMGGQRSGDQLKELKATDQLLCAFDRSSGLFTEFSIISWKAFVGNQEFKGKSAELSPQLVDAVNKARENEVLRIIVELKKNSTGHTTAEGIFLLK